MSAPVKTYIVFGPMACGKTRHRELIATLLTNDAKRFVEIDECSAKPKAGHVHLTNDLSAAERKLKKAGIVDITIRSFFSFRFGSGQ
jgi:hypothetical protein